MRIPANNAFNSCGEIARLSRTRPRLIRLSADTCVILRPYLETVLIRIIQARRRMPRGSGAGTGDVGPLTPVLPNLAITQLPAAGSGGSASHDSSTDRSPAVAVTPVGMPGTPPTPVPS